MKNINLFIIQIGLIFFSQSLYSQENFKFINVVEDEKFKTVNFNLTGFKDEFHKKELYNKLIADKNIGEFIIDNENNCKLILIKNYDADYIYNIISPMGVEFKLESVKQVNNNQLAVPENYPVRKNTGNDILDEENYQRAIKQWKKQYPEEWEQYKNENRNK